LNILNSKLHPSFELPPALAGGKNYDCYVIGFSQIISAKAFLLISILSNGLKPNPINF